MLNNVKLAFDYAKGDIILLEKDDDNRIIDTRIITGELMQALVYYLNDGEHLEIDDGVRAVFGWDGKEAYELELTRVPPQD